MLAMKCMRSDDCHNCYTHQASICFRNSQHADTARGNLNQHCKVAGASCIPVNLARLVAGAARSLGFGGGMLVP